MSERGIVPLTVRGAELLERVLPLADRVSDPAGELSLRPALVALGDALRDEPAGRPDRAATLATRLGLSPFEYDLLLLAGLPEEHEVVARLARYSHPRGEPFLTMAGVAAVLDLDARGRQHLRRALDGGLLRRHHLVAGGAGDPLPDRSLRLPSGLWSVLRGVDHWPETLTPMHLAEMPGPGIRAGDLASAAGGAGPRLVVVTGDRRDDVELAGMATAALHGRGRPSVAIDAADLDRERTPAWSAHVVARDAVPVVVGRPERPPLPDHPGAVVVAASAVTGVAMDHRPAVTVELPPPALGDAVAMWHRLLPELNGAGTELAGLLRVGELRAAQAVTDSRAAAATVDPGALSVAGVVAHVRRRTDVSLPASVRLEHPDAGWHQLVIPDGERRLLTSVVGRVREQARVLHDWGFARAARCRGGARVLLSGPPGTGKTLAVEVIAAELGLDLLVVDLSALVSKWLGETEKNIAEVFDAAERCQAVLFFDEADAVFGRRTDGSDAQARWANLETAYLLGRIDRFDGLVVLATNLRRNIDDAFVRRLDVVVELDEPDRAAREELWRCHLPAAAPQAEDVDLAALAAMYEVTGGLIRNATLAAAFAAAATGGPIDQAALIAAVHDEYRKAGRSFPGVPRRAPVAAPGGGG
jgi:hypothetical protein